MDFRHGEENSGVLETLLSEVKFDRMFSKVGEMVV